MALGTHPIQSRGSTLTLADLAPRFDTKRPRRRKRKAARRPKRATSRRKPSGSQA